MPKICFKGTVLPKVVEISFTDIPQSKWEWTEEALTLEFVIRIVKSQIEVECTLDRYEDGYMVELYRRAFDLARACVNVAAFGTGFGVTIFFDTFVGPNGTPSALLFTNPNLVGECTAFKMDPATLEERKTLEKVLSLV